MSPALCNSLGQYSEVHPPKRIHARRRREKHQKLKIIHQKSTKVSPRTGSVRISNLEPGFLFLVRVLCSPPCWITFRDHGKFAFQLAFLNFEFYVRHFLFLRAGSNFEALPFCEHFKSLFSDLKSNPPFLGNIFYCLGKLCTVLILHGRKTKYVFIALKLGYQIANKSISTRQYAPVQGKTMHNSQEQ